MLCRKQLRDATLVSGCFIFSASSSIRSHEYIWGTLYATYTLVEAQQSGFAVDADALKKRALTFLENRLAQMSYPQSVELADLLSERAFICHILAKAGQAPAGWISRLLESEHQMPYDARIQLALALIYAQQPKEAAQLLERIGLPEQHPMAADDPQLRSPVRETAWLLMAWLKLAPEDVLVQQCVDRLTQAQRNGTWRNTQENALALLALGHYSDMVASTPKAFSGHFDKESFTDKAPLNQSCKGPNTHVLSNNGPGTVFYHISMTGHTLETQPSSCQGLEIRSSLLDPDHGTELDTRTFQQGDLVIVQLKLDTLGRELNGVVIEDLLPAGFEIENARLKNATTIPWLKDKTSRAIIHQEMRDDRIILFTGQVKGVVQFHYAARAVSPGSFTYPSLSAESMYSPSIRSSFSRAPVQIEAYP